MLSDHEGVAKVTDFGIARTLEEDGLTVDGRVLGTTDYVSPEQALGRPVTGQSDLYSLGIVLYEMLTGEVPFRGENQVAVAMKHVREEIPDVRDMRPEISAALAAVLDTATAKRETERYANDREMITDLEDVLRLEAARAGSASGEATTVLRALPPEASRSLPLRLRSPRRIALLGLVAVIVVAAVTVFITQNTHNGPGPLPQNAPRATPHEVTLCATCAHDYNPDAPSGPKTQHPSQDGYAIDGDRNTAWSTETYYDGLDKPGVGLYVKVTPVAARSLRLDTATPDYNVAVYGARGAPDLDTFVSGHSGWMRLGSASSVAGSQTIRLRTGAVRYRYYLVWITSLGNHNQVAINEVALYT